MYLQPIFDSKDINKHLPNESKRFKSVDSTWRHTMTQVKQVPKVLPTCTKQGRLESLQEANKNLDYI